MSVYSELMVTELFERYHSNTLPITNKELIDILFDKCDYMDSDFENEVVHLEEQLETSEKENKRLLEDLHELEQKIENIRRIL